MPCCGGGLLHTHVSYITDRPMYARTHDGHAGGPAIVVTNGLQQAAAVAVQHIGEELSALANVEVLWRDYQWGLVSCCHRLELTGSLQLPPGAPPHFSLVICMRPCSPPPPTVSGLQEDSCIAIEAMMIGGTEWIVGLHPVHMKDGVTHCLAGWRTS